MSLQDLRAEVEKDDSTGFLEDQVEEIQSNGSSLSSFLKSKLREEPTSEEHVSYRPKVYFHSSEHMEELGDESVHLSITSPPYNAGWQYGEYEDTMDYITEYLPMLARVFTETYRVLKPGGRFCVNVPSLLRSGAAGGYPIAADITRMMVSNDGAALCFVDDSMHGSVDINFKGRDDIDKLRATTDWVIREEISWVKDFNDDGLAPNGSFPRPWGVLLNNFHESILVFQKPGQRSFDDMDEERIESSKIDKRDDDMCDDVWFISPDSWSPKYTGDEDIPVFPEKLVRRAIQLWSYKGDTVLDPFGGRCTTAKVSKEEERYSVCYEIRDDLKRDIKAYTAMDNTGLGDFV